MMGIELMTSSLPRMRSTPELHRQCGAEDEVRTRDPQLGRLMLYQLSYFRLFVGGAGFEPTKTYVSRFTVCPSWPLWYPPSIKCFLKHVGICEPIEGVEPTTSRLQIMRSGQLSYIGKYFKDLSHQKGLQR